MLDTHYGIRQSRITLLQHTEVQPRACETQGTCWWLLPRYCMFRCPKRPAFIVLHCALQNKESPKLAVMAKYTVHEFSLSLY